MTWVKRASAVLDQGPGGSWDSTCIGSKCVIHNGDLFEMWYAGGAKPTIAEKIGYANSTDGLAWTKSAGAVLGGGMPGSWESAGISEPVVLLDGATYKMWYTGFDGFIGISATNAQIGYATSPDGVTWTKCAQNPVMGFGGAGAWDSAGVYPSTVLKEDGEYKMWYGGYDGLHVQLGFATSPDGLTWTRYASNPILTVGAGGAWDENHVTHFSVVNVSGTFQGWFGGDSGFSWGIGHAVSADGLNWNKDANNPVMAPQGTGWESHDNMDPWVIYNGTGYKMWFSGVTDLFDPWVYSFGYAETVPPQPATLAAPADDALTNDTRPRLDWKFTDSGGGNETSAFRVQVARDAAFACVTADSGRIRSAATSYVPGKALADGRWYWRARVWDGNGLGGDWSASRKVRIDATPPANPTDIRSSSHQTGNWSKVAIIKVDWTVPAGGDPGSGYDGFSTLWDSSPTTLPDCAVVSAGTSSTSPAMPESGGVYFHLRARDVAGNWNRSAAHFGPFCIDPTPPANPLFVDSASHVPGRWSNDSAVEVFWSGADGSLSGIGGYSTSWDEQADALPPARATLGAGSWNATSPLLADGQSWYFHVRAMDGAGNWNGSAATAGPFWIDTAPPDDPHGVWSSSHAPGNWSNVRTIVMNWSAGEDGMSGIGGYSFLYDRRPDTVPPGELAVGGDSLSSASTALADGDGWHFHLRAQDRAGNWNGTAVHAGPFKIDATAPANPSSLSSASHVPGMASNESTVEISWPVADGGASGLGGYSLLWDRRPGTLPPETVNAGADAVNSTSPPLADGDWYFHIRAVDGAGNWAPDALHGGPFRINTTVPPPPDLPPVIIGLSGPQNVSINATGDINFSVQAVDPEGKALGYRWSENGQTLGTASDLSFEFLPGQHTVTLEVDDGAHRLTRDFNFTVLPPPAPPEPETIPDEGSAGAAPALMEGPTIYVAASSLVAPFLLLGLFATSGEWFKYRFILFFLPLYTRLHKEELLDHELRGILRGYILADPGIHYNELVRQVRMANGTVAYHLSTLEREGIIKSRRDGVLKRFYPAEMRLSSLPVRLTGVQLLILKAVQKQEGQNQRAIAESLDIPYLTVHRHINKMVRQKVLRLEKAGISTRCFTEAEWQSFDPGENNSRAPAPLTV